MIEENSNKKGDVLGTARIAGIMAAKRTADVIPLCHSVSISKAEVEVTLSTKGHDAWKSGADDCRAVMIQAQVQCVGPTGIEMEALTAASIAALTIYDMCKAVDKRMVIESTKLVYKSGGASGEFLDDEWNTER